MSDMYVDAKTKSVVLNAPDPFLIRDFLGRDSRLITHPDFNVAIKHTRDAARLLLQFGWDIPTPIITQYKWPGKYPPYQHQIDMASFMSKHDRCFNLSEMGAMKTAATLWAADYLMNTGVIKKVAIVSPLSTVRTVWLKDIYDVLLHRQPVVVHGTRQKRKDMLDADVDFYVMNHDALALRIVHSHPRWKDIDLIILDEAQFFRNSGTDKYRFLAGLMTPTRKLWMLTGTPCPNDPRDVWALARLIDRKRVPEHYGTWERETMTQVSQYKWVPKRDSFVKAYAAMQPAIRFEKRDCNINLPTVMPPRNIEVENTPEQNAMLSDMRLLFRAQLAMAGQLTAVNAADKINKLRQILLGCVKTGEDNEYEIIPHAPRVKALLDLIQAASNKVLVVVPFKGIIRSLADELGKHVSVGVLNGDVPINRRVKIIDRFKNETHPHTLLCHPKVMAHGLNLTEADTLIFYGPIYSNDEYEQVCERFNRLGQKHTMWIYRIGSDALDWDIYDVVDQKRLNQQSLLTMYRTHVDKLAA